MVQLSDTIVAPATPPGQGGVAIVRLSGPDAARLLAQVFTAKSPMESHVLRYGRVMDGAEEIDRCLAVLMRGPASYTGEDVAELHLHGAPIAVDRTLALCCRLGARLAGPGEFSLRAFRNGRISLTQAEAVMDLMQARSVGEHRLAVSRLSGALQRKITALQEELTRQRAAIEACIDFPEDDLEERTAQAVDGPLDRAEAELHGLVRSGEAAARLMSGVRVALVGRPNVGKSSLLNALCGEQRAIVTPVPGTTRDVVTAELTLGGIGVTLQDTAGLRPAAEEIEREGVRRAQETRDRADAVLFVCDASQGVSAEEEAQLLALGDRALTVLNKCDLPLAESLPLGLHVSAATGEGMPELLAALGAHLTGGSGLPEDALLTSHRHMQAAREALSALSSARRALRERLPMDCAAVDLREAWHALGVITGESADEALIEHIFANFCVGK